jgi:hypothetical protein
MNWRPPLVNGGADRTQNHPDTRGTRRVSIANFQTPHPTMPTLKAAGKILVLPGTRK